MWDIKFKKGKKTKHEQLVNHITRLIDKGTLKPGQMLPTQREISARTKISIGTVIKVFTELERRGYVKGEVGRGTFVSDYQYLSSSIENTILNFRNFEAPEFTNLSSYRALISGLNDVAQQKDLYFKLGYIEPSGSTEHKEAIAEWLKVVKLKVEPNDVLICGGTQHGIYIALQTLCNQGDAIMVESYCNLTLQEINEVCGYKTVPIEMDDDGIIPEAFDQACKKTKSKVLYLMPTLHNPTCIVSPKKRREEILQVAKKHRVIILEVGVMDALLATPQPTLASYSSENVIYISSFSKTISPGIRVGYIHTNKELLEKIEMRSRASLWMNSPLLNEVITDLIKTGKAMTLLNGKRETIAERQKVLAKTFKGLSYKTHPNAFHVWLTLPDYWKLKEFKEALLAKNIIVQPSNVFSLSKNDAYDAVRISMGSPKTIEELTTGLQIIADTAREQPH